jgi:hypothetical protein
LRRSKGAVNGARIMGRKTMPQLWQMKRKLNHTGKENAAGR